MNAATATEPGPCTDRKRRSNRFVFDPPRLLRDAGTVSDLLPQPSAATPAEGAPAVFARFETELQVRPDDIDMYQHVHSSRYMDYVLAARFDQMERCYGMAMAEFQRLGYGWFMAATQMHFRRPLGLGDRFVVRTWVESFTLIGLRVRFEIEARPGAHRCCEGWFDYVMVALETARPVRIPDWIRVKYSI